MSLRARLTLGFLVLALVPSLFLSLFVLRQLVSTVEWWDSAGAEEALTSSVAVAKTALKRMEAGLRLSAGPLFELSRQRELDLSPGSTDRMFVERYLRDTGLDLYQVYVEDDDGWHLAGDVAPPAVVRVEAFDLSEELTDGRVTAARPAQSVTGAFALLDSIPGGVRPRIVAVGYGLPPDFFLQLSEIQLGMGIFRRLSVYADVFKWYFRIAVLAVLLLVGTVAVFAGRALAKHLTQPIATLSESFARVDGDASIRVEPSGAPEVRRLAESFNAMTIRLVAARIQLERAERSAAWQGVAHQVAHEIKNPLTTISLALYNMERDFSGLAPEPKARVEKSFEALKRELDSMADLANSFGSLGTLPALQAGRVDVNAMVESLLAVSPWPHVTIDTALDPDRPQACGDERQLRRVLRNLVKNACEAQPQGGHVRISTRPGPPAEAGEPANVAIEVEDDGPGMDEETVTRAFDPGFSTKGRGSGVGLTVSQRVIEQHGGTLEIDSAPGRGTRVTMVIPGYVEAAS
ncbi:MAG: HAMP domain-containing sensor histidine kinase [Candidatus Eisenbacteria bacterium]